MGGGFVFLAEGFFFFFFGEETGARKKGWKCLSMLGVVDGTIGQLMQKHACGREKGIISLFHFPGGDVNMLPRGRCMEKRVHVGKKRLKKKKTLTAPQQKVLRIGRGWRNTRFFLSP